MGHERGAFALAAAMHGLLALFLFHGIHWQNSTPPGAQAELWTEVPGLSTPHATPAPAPRARNVEADIALQRKQHPQRQTQLQAQLQAQRARRQRGEQLMQQQFANAQNKVRQQQELRVKQAAEQAARQQIDEARNARLKALQAMAGTAYSASGSERATSGTGAGSGGSASSSYGDKVRRHVQPNIVFAGDAAPGTSTVVAINCAPDGHVLDATIVSPSGNPGWDGAAMRAVQKSDPMPLDDNGTAPAHFTITFRPSAN